MNETLKARLIYYASALAGLGSWMITLENWSAATDPVRLGALLIIEGSIAAGALGKSIIKPKQ